MHKAYTASAAEPPAPSLAAPAAFFSSFLRQLSVGKSPISFTFEMKLER